MYPFFALLLVLIFPCTASGQWDFSRHSVPLDEIVSGGPPRDGIPMKLPGIPQADPQPCPPPPGLIG